MITTIFCTLFFTIVSWMRYNIYFCKAAGLFASGLVFTYKLVDFAIVSTLITFFTDDVNAYHLRKAAALVNIQEGLSASFLIVVIFPSSLFNHIKIMISFSTVSYIIGLMLLYITASEKVAKSKCYPINIIGIILLDVSNAGSCTFLREFFASQLRYHELEGRKNEDRVMARRKVWWSIAWCCSVIVTFLISNYSWEKSFKFSALVMASAFFLFLIGIRFYHSEETATFGNGSSPFTIIFRVVKASILKRHLNYPSSSNLFLDNDGSQLHLSPQVKWLRWIDKAAIVESNISITKQREVGRLCTVTQVKESKFLLKLVPIWITCFLFGLLLSTGKTFFPRQEINNFYLLYLSQKLTSLIVSYLYQLILSKLVLKSRQKQAKIVRILARLVLCACCFVVAWRVEDRRLHIVFKKGLQDKLNDSTTSPLSILCLVPQFCLLGLSEGFVVDGLKDFMMDQLPESQHKYVSTMTEFFIKGKGNFLSILFVYANKSLFATALNHSHLDIYYMRLMVVGIINFFCSCFILIFFYRSWHTRIVDENSQKRLLC